MNQHTDDTALGEAAPDLTTSISRPPVDPPPYVQMLTIADVLAAARLPEKHARVCLRADLEARRDQLVADLATMVTASGEIIENPDASAGEVSTAGLARQKADELDEVRREMVESMWFPLFRGKSSDDMAVFNKQHWPKNPDRDGNVDLGEYNVLLVSECAVQPKMTAEDVNALKRKLGSAAYKALVATAQEVCTSGGVDVPKSPVSLRNLTRQ